VVHRPKTFLEVCPFNGHVDILVQSLRNAFQRAENRAPDETWNVCDRHVLSNNGHVNSDCDKSSMRSGVRDHELRVNWRKIASQNDAEFSLLTLEMHCHSRCSTADVHRDKRDPRIARLVSQRGSVERQSTFLGVAARWCPHLGQDGRAMAIVPASTICIMTGRVASKALHPRAHQRRCPTD
jgi:hypothetical protein